jgi:glycosyltransferase involved in cell wall biosynthesis
VKKPRLIVIGPTPPPIHGVTVSTALVLESPLVHEHFNVRHLDTSDRRAVTTLGRWDIKNVKLGLRNVFELLGLLRGKRGIVYLPISQGPGAFLRDSLFINLAGLSRWKVAVHLRGSEFHEFYARRGRIFRLWIRLTLRRVDSAAVMGESLRHVLEAFVPPEKVAVVPNGTPRLGAELHLRRRKRVLFLSNLLTRKGVVEAVEAAVIVARQDPEVRFIFAGSWESPELERTVRGVAEEASDRIHFMAPVAGREKIQLLLSSGILLFPPVKPEGHPRVVLEGLAAGLPIVTTDRGAIAQTVIDGECGFVLDDPVPARLADRICELIGDRALYERMSHAAQARHLAEFTPEATDGRLVRWLLETAEVSPGPSPSVPEEAHPCPRIQGRRKTWVF